MIKVLHIINGANLGGISTMILNYYSKMDRNKIQFDFVTHNRNVGINGKKLENLGSRFMYIPCKRDNFIKYVKELDKIIKDGDYDAIHVHENLSSYVALFLAYKNKIKIRIAHGHNADFRNNSLIKKIVRHISHFLIKLFSTKCIACSSDSLKYTFGIKNKKTVLLPNSIDINKFNYNEEDREKIRSELHLSKNEIVIGSVGRMSPEKNHVFLVNVMNQIKRIDKNIKMVIVGDGDEYNKCINLANEIGVRSNIIFTGARSDISALMNSFDLFLLPSLNEGLGIVAIEAAASGLQVLMSDKVPTDLAFIPKSKFIELNEKLWVKEILESDFKRIDCKKELIENGYDINESVKKLEEIYCNEK